MKVKLQEKTRLRKLMESNLDTTLTLDWLYIYSDGSYDFLGCNIVTCRRPKYKWIDHIVPSEYNDYCNDINYNITHFFKKIERDLNA